MANGGDIPMDDDICGVCQTRLEIDGTCLTCLNRMQDAQNYIDMGRTSQAQIKEDPMDLTDEAGNDEVSKALAVHPVVSVEDRRMKYSIKSLLGKRKSETTEMAIASSLSLRVTCYPDNKGLAAAANVVPNQSFTENNPVQATSFRQQIESDISQDPQLKRGQRWSPAISPVQSGASGPSERKKKKEFPGRVEDIRLKMWLCVRDAVPSPLPLDEDNINAFRRLFEINNFKDSDQFSFYDVGNRTPNQMIAAVDNTLKYQIKHFCFIMFAGQMINGKKVDTANDLVCIFKLTSESQMTRQPPIILWRCEF